MGGQEEGDGEEHGLDLFASAKDTLKEKKEHIGRGKQTIRKQTPSKQPPNVPNALLLRVSNPTTPQSLAPNGLFGVWCQE
jgi:hypothetical protein